MYKTVFLCCLQLVSKQTNKINPNCVCCPRQICLKVWWRNFILYKKLFAAQIVVSAHVWKLKWPVCSVQCVCGCFSVGDQRDCCAEIDLFQKPPIVFFLSQQSQHEPFCDLIFNVVSRRAAQVAFFLQQLGPFALIVLLKWFISPPTG